MSHLMNFEFVIKIAIAMIVFGYLAPEGEGRRVSRHSLLLIAALIIVLFVGRDDFVYFLVGIGILYFLDLVIPMVFNAFGPKKLVSNEVDAELKRLREQRQK